MRIILFLLVLITTLSQTEAQQGNCFSDRKQGITICEVEYMQEYRTRLHGEDAWVNFNNCDVLGRQGGQIFLGCKNSHNNFIQLWLSGRRITNGALLE